MRWRNKTLSDARGLSKIAEDLVCIGVLGSPIASLVRGALSRDDAQP